MFTVNTDMSIKMNRGDDAQFPVFVNNGTRVYPERYKFEYNDGTEICFYILPVNGSFNDFILKKTFKSDGQVITEIKDKEPITTVNITNINSSNDYVIQLLNSDTADIYPMEYRYVIRAKLLVSKIKDENILKREDNKYITIQITNKYPFFLLDDDINRAWNLGDTPVSDIDIPPSPPIPPTPSIEVQPLFVEENGVYTAEENKAYNPVTVNVSQGNIEDADVRFIDYDGTVIYGYTADEFLALSEMPENPTHDGLISQGWNWSFEDAQEYVNDYGMLDIGQTYITDDGNTRLYITVDQLFRSDVSVCFSQTISNGVIINWGDGSEEETFEGVGNITSAHHVYSAIGDYCITLSPIEGCILGLGINDSAAGYCIMGKTGNRVPTISAVEGFAVYTNMLNKVEIGKDSEISIYAFSRCYNLKSVTIPIGIVTISQYAFYDCYNLLSIIFPNSLTTIQGNAFYDCSNIQSVCIPKGFTSFSGSNIFMNCTMLERINIPNSVTTLGSYLFSSCGHLKDVTIPNSVTSTGQYTFMGCNHITKITIPNSVETIDPGAFNGCISLKEISIPDSVTTINYNAFSGCYLLRSINMPNSVTTLGRSAFSSCRNLKNIVLSNNITNIDKTTFLECYTLQSIIIPNKVTSIGENAFQKCYGLSNITIPSSVVSIGVRAFYTCSSLSEIRFEGSTPPTAATNAFNGISPSEQCKIYVPTGSLAAYTSAANYPNPNYYTYIEY